MNKTEGVIWISLMLAVALLSATTGALTAHRLQLPALPAPLVPRVQLPDWHEFDMCPALRGLGVQK